ncbi:hypothetical protein N1851_007999 [Merluccius polli]|uniref:Uncharacterized protein n=1 Tax=Merluccius polli TaxID=89951 RepID=A0AA47P934_MERPO|nr:hypothetical protein N1851_007999 [Merluccius polli]
MPEAMEEDNEDQEGEDEVPSEPSEPSTNPTLPLVVQEQSSRGTARNKARTTKGKACDLEAEKVEILRAVSQTMLGTRQDVDEAFGRQMACELKQVQDQFSRMQLRRNIMQMIYDVQESEHRAARYPQASWQGNPTAQHHNSNMSQRQYTEL